MLLRIQGLRGIAIISVLLFHLWPTTFPNGFVGVDIFFVLSGYLMAMIFSKHSVINLCTIVDFYYKRAKRIFPLYYLILPLTLLAGHLFLGKYWISTTNEFALYSLAFLKNMKTIWDGSNYFISFQSSNRQKDLFLHLWSLAVEIQFYLIVPFIFVLLNFFKKKYQKIGFLALISTIACAQYYYSNPIFSFNYFLSRFWQFGTGMIGFLLLSIDLSSKKSKTVLEKVTEKLQDPLILVASVPILLMIAPQTVDAHIMRPLATFSCFLLLVLENDFSKKFLTSQFIVYTGDISYTLYLVHWPIITLFGATHTLQFVLGIILITSIFIHTYYDTACRAFSVKKTLVLFLCLAIFNSLIFTSLIYCPFVQTRLENYKEIKASVDKKEAILRNTAFAATSVEGVPKGRYNSNYSSRFPTFVPPWGVYDYPNGTGTNKIMVIGNSYALNEVNIIQEAFNGNYSQFRMLAALGFQVLYDEWIQSTERFHGQLDKAFEIIEEYQPDYLFVVTRYQSHQKRLLRGEDVSQDILVQQYNNYIAQLEKMTRKGIYIHGLTLLRKENLSGPTPTFRLLLVNELIDALVEGRDTESFHLNKKEADDEMFTSLKRMEAIVCQKCHLYSILPAFLDGNRYLAYDPMTLLSFIDNDIHLTIAGQERLRPIYKKLVKTLI